MERFCVLSEVVPDDVLADWRRYCLARRMSFGGAPCAAAHTFTIVAEEHRLCVTIGSPEGASPAETLGAFLRDYLRRHPHLRLVDLSSEQALLEQTQYEGCLGFIMA